MSDAEYLSGYADGEGDTYNAVRELEERLEEAERIIAELLKHGEHDGPCRNIEGEDFYSPYDSCAIHIRVSKERADAARAFLSVGVREPPE